MFSPPCQINKYSENQTQPDMVDFISAKRLTVGVWSQFQHQSAPYELTAQKTDNADNENEK